MQKKIILSDFQKKIKKLFQKGYYPARISVFKWKLIYHAFRLGETDSFYIDRDEHKFIKTEYLYDNISFPIDASTCPLCIKYECHDCPLFKVENNKTCGDISVSYRKIIKVFIKYYSAKRKHKKTKEECLVAIKELIKKLYLCYKIERGQNG